MMGKNPSPTPPHKGEGSRPRLRLALTLRTKMLYRMTRLTERHRPR
jgi:hypothetical protein